MCAFADYIRLLEELKDMGKESAQLSKQYNNELKLFQGGIIIDASNAERVKQKFDLIRQHNEKLDAKEGELRATEDLIGQYLVATNGMAIRYIHEFDGLRQPMIFDMETDSYGQPKLRMTREI